MTCYNSMLEDLRAELRANLTVRRLRHTENVLDSSLELGARYGADSSKVTVIALAHDRFRCAGDEELNKLIERYHVNPDYMDNNNLGHGPVAAGYVEEAYGIKDKDILNAIKYHTTGRRGMGLYEKIIFLADATEKERNFPGVCDIRRAAEKGLDTGVRDFLINTVSYLKEAGIDIDNNTVLALEYMDGLVKEQ